MTAQSEFVLAVLFSCWDATLARSVLLPTLVTIAFATRWAQFTRRPGSGLASVGFPELVLWRGRGHTEGERRYLNQLGHWDSHHSLRSTNAKPTLSSALYSLFLKFLHPRFRHETLRIGIITPCPPLELRGLRCGGPGGYSGEAGSYEKEPCRCLHRPGHGCTSRSWRYVMSCGSHNPRGLTAFDSAGKNIAAGHLNLCLCQSAVPGFLDSNPVAKKVVDGVGKDGARDYFVGLVSGSSFIIPHLHDF